MNGTLFHGQNRLKPEMLSYLPESSVLKLEGKHGKTVRLDYVRDAIFLAEMPGNRRAVFRIILGTEGQGYIDYGMAVRNMGYDAGAYLSQLRDGQQNRREEKNWEDGNEFTIIFQIIS